jgi:hypothetical protein
MLRWRIFPPALALVVGFMADAAGYRGWASGAAAFILVFICLMVAGVIVAPYQQRDDARDELRATRTAKVGRKAQLAALFAEGSRIEREKITLEGYPDWKARLEAWGRELLPFLEERYGVAAKESFLNPPPYMAADVLGSVSPAHSNVRLKLSHQLQTLRPLMDLPDGK